MRRKLGGALAVAAVCALGVGQAQASTLVGSNLVGAPDNGFNCGETCTQILATLSPSLQAPGGIAAPMDGVVVRWRIDVGANFTDSMTFRIARPAGDPGEYTGAGTSTAVTPPMNQVSDYDARMPIQQGDLIGIEADSQIQAFRDLSDPLTGSFAIWGVGPANGPLVDGGAPRAAEQTNSPYELLVQAEIEPDSDGDEFGDETQDECPTDETTQGPCTGPPQTTIKRGPTGTIERRTARFAFKSDEPGSSFECRLDRRSWRNCASPKRVRGLDDGRHVFRVRATDQADDTDPTPAKRRFRVDA